MARTANLKKARPDVKQLFSEGDDAVSVQPHGTIPVEYVGTVDLPSVVIDERVDPAGFRPSATAVVPHDLAGRARYFADQAKALSTQLTSNEAYTKAIAMLREIKSTRTAWAAHNDDPIAAAQAALDAAKTAFKSIDTPLKEGFDALKEAAETFVTNGKLAQREALAASASACRVQAATELHAASTKAFDEAVALGDQAKANRILATAPPKPSALPMAPPPRSTVVPKVEGATAAQNWTWEIVDESLIPNEYFIETRELNRKAITGVVKALKDKTNIAGIKVRPDTSLRITDK